MTVIDPERLRQLNRLLDFIDPLDVDEVEFRTDTVALRIEDFGNTPIPEREGQFDASDREDYWNEYIDGLYKQSNVKEGISELAEQYDGTVITIPETFDFTEKEQEDVVEEIHDLLIYLNNMWNDDFYPSYPDRHFPMGEEEHPTEEELEDELDDLDWDEYSDDGESSDGESVDDLLDHYNDLHGDDSETITREVGEYEQLAGYGERQLQVIDCLKETDGWFTASEFYNTFPVPPHGEMENWYRDNLQSTMDKLRVDDLVHRRECPEEEKDDPRVKYQYKYNSLEP